VEVLCLTQEALVQMTAPDKGKASEYTKLHTVLFGCYNDRFRVYAFPEMGILAKQKRTKQMRDVVQGVGSGQ
jgi:hypothetical protein